MQMGRCCQCGMPAVLKPIRRFLQFDSILSSERTTDTVDWEIDEIDADSEGPYHSPYMDEDDTDVTLYMKPVRFVMCGAESSDSVFNPAFIDSQERTYSNNQLATLQARHTVNAMPHLGMLPAPSHAWPIRFTAITYDIPGGMGYRTVDGSSPSNTYMAEVDAWRVNLNGVDVTGIISSITPPIKFNNDWTNGGVAVDAASGRWKSSAAASVTIDDVVQLEESDLISVDVWYKVRRGNGWGTYISLGIINIYDGFRLSSSTATTAYRTTDDPPESLNYVFYADIGAMNVNRRVPRNYPWTIEYSSGSAWTFGGLGNLNLSSIPADTTRSVYSRPSSELVVAGANTWDVTTVANIDDAVFAPDAGDGSVIEHSGAGDINFSASVRYNHLFSASGTVTKVVVWYRARCDNDNDGNIVTVKMRYSVGVTVHERTATPAALTNTWTWYSIEFSGTDIAGMSSGSGVQAQFDSELQTSDGWVQVDVLYVEKQLSDAISVTQRDTSIEATHDNGDKVSFDWGREVPELLFRNPAVPTLLGGPNSHALYKPEDSGDYFSVAPGSTAAGVWNPAGDTVFKRFGISTPGIGGFNAYHFFAFSDAMTDWDPYFPQYITLTRN